MDIDMEMGPDDEMDIEGDIELDTEEPAEETLEEMINAILAEEDGAMAGDEKKTSGRKRGSKRGDKAYINEDDDTTEEKEGEEPKDLTKWAASKPKTAQEIRDDKLRRLQALAAEEDTPEDMRAKKPRRKPRRNPASPTIPGRKNESVQILDDEKLIQEVTKRVKKRLAKYARAQKRQRRQRR